MQGRKSSSRLSAFYTYLLARYVRYVRSLRSRLPPLQTIPDFIHPRSSQFTQKGGSIGLLPAQMALACDMQILTSLWLIYIISKITQLPLGGHNVLHWGAEPVGCCTIKALYKPIDPIPPVPHFPWTCLWSLPYLYTRRFSSLYGTCCMGA